MKKAPERFWSHVDRSAGDDRCWPWTGQIAGGYGRFDGEYAHRIALSAKIGRPLAPGEHALHSCDNPPCCNPSHLRPGTPRDNANDRVERRRQRQGVSSGSENPNAKLTEAAVADIRASYMSATKRGAKGAAFDSLAQKYGVSRRTVEYVAHRGWWQHV